MTTTRDDWRMDADAGALLDGENPRADKLLTAEQLAARWQVPKSQVYRLARDERVKPVKLGRYRRFSLLAVEAFEQKGGADR
jgi:excisionase family DNA binding protein